jgi:DNA repair exonuclease SbcCD nuclease subunit
VKPIRVLFLSDTHLGFDMPQRPRVERRRRGPDFFASFERALAPALRGEVDLVLHGGDVLYRSRVPPRLVALAFEPLERVAERGIPVCVVPGNHERSRIPHPLLVQHPRIHLFDRPRSFAFDFGERGRLLLAGWPYHAAGVRGAFASLVEATGHRGVAAGARLLAIHHCVEGATVGPADYVFREGHDVIRGRDLPGDFAAVLSGHVHRAQRLSTDLLGRPLATPVLYPGSTERTSFAEKDEAKGYLVLDVDASCGPRGRLAAARFRRIPTRPMLQIELAAGELKAGALADALRALARGLPEGAILQIRLRDRPSEQVLGVVSAASLRRLLPPTMNVSVALPDASVWRGRRPRDRPPLLGQRVVHSARAEARTGWLGGR